MADYSCPECGKQYCLCELPDRKQKSDHEQIISLTAQVHCLKESIKKLKKDNEKLDDTLRLEKIEDLMIEDDVEKFEQFLIDFSFTKDIRKTADELSG